MYVIILWLYSTHILVNIDRVKNKNTTCQSFTCQPQLCLRPCPPTPCQHHRSPPTTPPPALWLHLQSKEPSKVVENGTNLN